MNEPIYNTHYYSVHLLDEPVIDEKDEMPPLLYGVVNKMTGLEEALITYLPAACETAHALSEKLLQYFPEEKTNIVTLH